VSGGLNHIYPFSNAGQGANPYATLVLGTDGFLYGTTQGGGAYTNQFGEGFGTAFRVDTAGNITRLVSFAGADGANPFGGLVQANDGSLYGMTKSGGTSNNGTVFRISFSAAGGPEITGVSQVGNQIRITWTGAVGSNYRFKYKTDLGQASWIATGGTIPATNPTMITPQSIGPEPVKFYRVFLVP
jgi:uncharacterized repeat protein (TIGR03803 family)